MATHWNSRRGRLVASAAAVLLLAGGANSVRLGLHLDASPFSSVAAAAQPPTISRSPQPGPTTIPPPSPSSSPAPPAPTDAPAAAPQGQTSSTPAGPVLPASAPVALDVPALGLHTNLIQVGLNGDGTLEVPPVQPGSPAGWYRYSPSPGQLGPAVILGHVKLQPGPDRRVLPPPRARTGQRRQRHPGRRRRRGVSGRPNRERRQGAIPDARGVYGDTTRSELRLITCSDYDQSAHTWKGNTVVYAHLLPSNAA